jgi:hypothetical protein
LRKTPIFSSKIAENCRKSQKIVEKRQKLSKIAEHCDHNIDPRSQAMSECQALHPDEGDDDDDDDDDFVAEADDEVDEVSILFYLRRKVFGRFFNKKFRTNFLHIHHLGQAYALEFFG